MKSGATRRAQKHQHVNGEREGEKEGERVDLGIGDLGVLTNLRGDGGAELGHGDDVL